MNCRSLVLVFCLSAGAWADLKNIGLDGPVSYLFAGLFFLLLTTGYVLGHLYLFLAKAWYLPVLALLTYVLFKLHKKISQ